MNEPTEQDFIEAGQEMVKVAAEALRMQERDRRKHSLDGTRAATVQPSLQNRVESWLRPGARFVSSAMGIGMDSDTVEAAEAAIRLTAAQLKAGRTEWVYETAVGQSVWLSAIALQLIEEARTVPPKRQAELIGLALRAQGACAKLVLSIGAMATMNAQPGGADGLPTLPD